MFRELALQTWGSFSYIGRIPQMSGASGRETHEIHYNLTAYLTLLLYLCAVNNPSSSNFKTKPRIVA